MVRPSPVQKGPNWLIRAFAERDSYIESIKPISGSGTTVTQAPNGLAVNVSQAGPGVAVTNVSWDSEEGALVVAFSNGTQASISFSACPTPPP